MIADPYYRTIQGFELLITKEWIYFGHQFYTRNGAEINQNDSKKSPIFLEFLDCVYQLTNQYPFAFEFNNRFLLEIARHIYSRQFGTFLADSYQELNLYKLEDKTLSLWSHLNSTKEKFLNPYYKTFADKDWFLLRPGNHLKYIKLWEEYFLKYSWIPKPAIEIADDSGEISFYQSDFHERISIKKSNEVQELKNKLEKLKDTLTKLEEKKRKKEDDLQSQSSESEQGSRFFERLSIGSQDQNTIDQTRLSKSIDDEDNQNNNEEYEFHFHET